MSSPGSVCIDRQPVDAPGSPAANKPRRGAPHPRRRGPEPYSSGPLDVQRPPSVLVTPDRASANPLTQRLPALGARRDRRTLHRQIGQNSDRKLLRHRALGVLQGDAPLEVATVLTRPYVHPSPNELSFDAPRRTANSTQFRCGWLRRFCHVLGEARLLLRRRRRAGRLGHTNAQPTRGCLFSETA